MTDETLAEYMAESGWNDMSDRERQNVIATFVIDLENRVAALESE